jgi:hypothetical protein
MTAIGHARAPGPDSRRVAGGMLFVIHKNILETSMNQPFRHPVDERLPLARLGALGLQHVLVMYAGAIAVPLIVGRALKLPPEQVSMLISADLFCCGIVTLIQSLGLTSWFGIRLPVMMGVTFAAVGPMVAIANAVPGVDGARAIFGAGIGAGAVALLIAPLMSRLLRFFPPVVTGTIILIIGVTLMRVGVGWAMGGPDNTAQSVDTAKLAALVDAAGGGRAAAGRRGPRAEAGRPRADDAEPELRRARSSRHRRVRAGRRAVPRAVLPRLPRQYLRPAGHRGRLRRRVRVR